MVCINEKVILFHNTKSPMSRFMSLLPSFLVALITKSWKRFRSIMLLKRTIIFYMPQNHPELYLDTFTTHFWVKERFQLYSCITSFQWSLFSFIPQNHQWSDFFPCCHHFWILKNFPIYYCYENEFTLFYNWKIIQKCT